jgi:uncharacterized protein YcbX
VKEVERGAGIGTVAALWRYPVKSMLGDELPEAVVTEQGFAGDRAYAVVDVESGQVRNAKRAGWQDLFEFRAALKDAPGDALSRLRVTLPDGEIVVGEEDRDEKLSRAFGREVRLVSGDDGGFFDLGVIHLLTTASLKRLGEIYSGGCFDARRFRPNIVLELDSGEVGFVEEEWPGETLRIGDEVRLRVTESVARCVMVTLPQADLPEDQKIISTIYHHNGNQVGVYAEVLRGGEIHRGDRLVLV